MLELLADAQAQLSERLVKSRPMQELDANPKASAGAPCLRGQSCDTRNGFLEDFLSEFDLITMPVFWYHDGPFRKWEDVRVLNPPWTPRTHLHQTPNLWHLVQPGPGPVITSALLLQTAQL